MWHHYQLLLILEENRILKEKKPDEEDNGVLKLALSVKKDLMKKMLDNLSVNLVSHSTFCLLATISFFALVFFVSSRQS